MDYGRFMARPLRIEYEGAYYHVLSRGNKQQAIFLEDDDRQTFLKTIARMSERFDVTIIAYVLMDNHYHLLIRTNRSNLSKSMQWLGTTYTTIFNLRNFQVGHLFQGRFKSILVENEAYLHPSKSPSCGSRATADRLSLEQLSCLCIQPAMSGLVKNQSASIAVRSG
jgi:REP element-mobilizing transposase RayT